MAASLALSADAVKARISGLSGWSLDGTCLFREVRFGDFVETFGFMTRVALAAESMGHHPDWSGSWNTVRFHLITHSAGGLTELDFELAERINGLI